MNDELERGPERLRGLSAGDEATQGLRMQISISGGLAPERVELDAELTGAGHLSGHMENALTDLAGSFDGQVSDSALSGLIELVGSEEFIGQPQEPVLFPPDTIVGSVEITLEGEPVGTYLAAVDEDQVAGTPAAGQPTSDLLARTLEAAQSLVHDGRS